jgi:hypothetical protein
MANEFDFYKHVCDVMRRRWGCSLVPYHEVYSYLGKRFCMRKEEIKELLKAMESGGYLAMKKRGIVVLGEK